MLDLERDFSLLEKLKKASADIRTDEQAVSEMADAVAELLGKNTLSIFDYFNAALALEKIAKYEKAICYYSKCMELLPKSSLWYAISGMKNRVKSKLEPTNKKYYALAISDFEFAAKIEKIPWRIEKWKMAGEEIKRQQVLQWREH